MKKVFYCESSTGYILLGGLTANAAFCVCVCVCGSTAVAYKQTHTKKKDTSRLSWYGTNRICHAYFFIILCVWSNQSNMCTTRTITKTQHLVVWACVSMSKPSSHEQEGHREKAEKKLP